MAKQLYFFLALFVGLSLQASPQKENNLEHYSQVANQHFASGFEENKGQITDDKGNVASTVLFRATIKGADFFITENGISYVFLQKLYDNTNPDLPEELKEKLEWRRMDMNLLGATIIRSNIITEDAVEHGSVNYFLGHCPNGIFDVKKYNKVVLKNIYPGIDWVFRFDNTQGIKYDFVVHPNADVSQIRMNYIGAGEAFVTPDKLAINIKTEFGEIAEGKLYTYQDSENNKINSYYKMQDGILSFEIGTYNTQADLIIDPPVQLTWATYYGGGANDGGKAIALDKNGNIFITGFTSSSNFPGFNPGGGAYFQGTSAGLTDAFIAKFNNAGVWQWSTYYGGVSDDRGFGITADNAGNVYVTGGTISTNFPLQNLAGSYNQTTKGVGTLTHDVFILKFNSAGVRQWATYYGGEDKDMGMAIITDVNDNLYVTGYAGCRNFPTLNPGTGGYHQPTYGGGTCAPQNLSADAFVLKFNSAGVRLWATYLGGNGGDAANSMAFDAAGNLYVAGFSKSTNFPVVNPGTGAYFQGTQAGSGFLYGDVFIAKFDANYNLLWSTYYGGSMGDAAESIKIDAKGNIILVGSTASTDFPLMNAPGAFFQANSKGPNGFYNYGDMFILKLDPTGARLWATYYGGAAEDIAMDVVPDPCGNIYVTGHTMSSDFPTKNPGGIYYYDGTYGGASTLAYGDLVMLNFSNTGARQWATYCGGSDNETGQSITIDGNGKLFLCGEIWGTGFPLANPGGGAYYKANHNGGPNDVLIASFTPLPSNINVQSSLTNVSCFAGSNGKALVNPSGGTSPYTYSWSNGQSAALATGLSSGTFSVIITDANCEIDTSFISITQPTALQQSVQVQNNVLCKGGNTGSAIATGSGGTSPYSFTWSNSNSGPSGTGLLAGVFSVTITDNNNCSVTTSVTITEPPTLLAFIPMQTNQLCYGDNKGSALAAGMGGTGAYSFLWLPGSQTTSTASALTAGAYSVTITDANNCTAINSITITEPPLLSVTIPSQNNVSCFGGSNGSATPSVAGGTGSYSYLWTPTSSTSASISNIPAGLYNLQVTDANGCSSYASTTITEPLPLTINTTTYDAHCNHADGYAVASANGGTGVYTYSWNTSPAQHTGTATNLAAGNYSVVATDVNGCTTIKGITIANLNSLTAQLSSLSNTKCFNSCDGDAIILISGGDAPYNYSWNTIPPQPTIYATGLCAGTYVATVSDKYNCVATVSVSITQPNALNASIFVQKPVSCYGGSDGELSSNISGGTPGYNYTWNTNPTQHNATSTNITAGNYILTVSDGNGCSTQATITITEPPALILSPTISGPMCQGQSSVLTLQASGGTPGYNYFWSNGQAGISVTVNPSASTVYSATVTDNNACSSITTLSVTVNELPVVSFTADKLQGCGPLCVNFTNTTSNSAVSSWQVFSGVNSSGNSASYCYQDPGSYAVSLTVTDVNGCSNTLAINNFITVHPNPVAAFSASPQPTTILSPTIYFTNNSQNANAWQWLFGNAATAISTQQNPFFTYDKEGNYTVTLVAVNEFGCTDTATDIITINPDYTVFVPNTFTPNGDGKNELFTPMGTGIMEESYELFIFDRWGDLIYKTSNIHTGWDGTANGGGIAQIDTYVWKLNCKDVFGKKHSYVGHVNLIR